MKKIFVRGIFVWLMGMFCSSLYAVTESLESYKVSVTIPALIGINPTVSSLQVGQNDDHSAASQEIETETDVRNNETILLNTIVVK